MAKWKDPVLKDLDKRRKDPGFSLKDYKVWAIEKFGKRTGEKVYQRAVEMEFAKKKEKEKEVKKKSRRERTKEFEFIENIK